MNESQIDPLSLSSRADRRDHSSKNRKSASRVTKLDRWLADQLAAGLDGTKVRIALWDETIRSDEDKMPVTLRIGDRPGLLLLVQDPGLQFGDLYSSGRITLDGDLLVVLDEAYRYLKQRSSSSGWLTRRRPKTPDLSDSRRNIHHHYNIGNEFYQLWLDQEALQYTCAYYADPSMTLEQAQQAKMHHVCRKLRLKPGDRVIEAGGGWGGFAIFMAKNYGARVRSFNISTEQVAYSRERAAVENQSKLVEFIEDDFRNISGRCDAFVSIGMLEHVGPGNYELLGNLIKRVLSCDGRGLVHSIGRDHQEPLNPWIEKRIFPGAYPPTLREMMEIFEPNGLSVLDIENIRLHYMRTLEHWLERYEQNIDQIREMFDESFVRAWRLYLAGSKMGFMHGSLQLFQLLFARSGVNSIPWTRDHIYSNGR